MDQSGNAGVAVVVVIVTAGCPGIVVIPWDLSVFLVHVLLSRDGAAAQEIVYIRWNQGWLWLLHERRQ